MTRVNYSDIAGRYDNNPVRHEIDCDNILTLAADHPWRVLDLGCGTGSYIRRQADLTHNQHIEWHGVDPNENMLNFAKSKVPFAKLKNARAENLPFADDFFDYVTSRFSFHHFNDGHAALREIRRVVKPGGFFKLVNLVPELSPDWWLFEYFPEARKIDEKRFWSLDYLKHETLKIGFTIRDCQLKLRETIDAKLVVNEARNRETSELLLISDEHYKAGLKRLENDLGKPGIQQVDWGLMIAEITFVKTP